MVPPYFIVFLEIMELNLIHTEYLRNILHSLSFHNYNVPLLSSCNLLQINFLTRGTSDFLYKQPQDKKKKKNIK